MAIRSKYLFQTHALVMSEDLPSLPSELRTIFLNEYRPILSADPYARSEVIINPVLLEVRRILNRQISVFSGEEFNVDVSVGLNGVCNFLISRSPEQLTVEAPAIVVVEAKKSDLKSGLGQCIAEMVAVQRFNQAKEQPLEVVYGCVTSGTQWRFLKLEEQTLTIDLTDYPLPPVEQILSLLVWMVKEV